MSVKQINKSQKYKAVIILPCFNCGSLQFISFQRIKIDNYKCLQKAKCHACKYEWIEFWYEPMQRQFFCSQPRRLSEHKKIIRQEVRK
jgi:hypothetical protein